MTVSVGLPGCKYSKSTEYTNRSSISDAGSDSGAVNISKMGGGIDVQNAPHGANLSTMGGDIHVGDVASFAKVKTMGGSITIDHATGAVDATTMGGPISTHSHAPRKAKVQPRDRQKGRL